MFMTPEPQIVQRLKELDVFTEVLSSDESEMRSSQMRAPAAVVLYGGYSVEKTSANHQTVGIKEQWDIVVILQANNHSANELNGEAKGFMESVMASLMGFTPEGYLSSLVPVTPEKPFYDETYGYYPMSFEVSRVIKRT